MGLLDVQLQSLHLMIVIQNFIGKSLCNRLQ